MASPACPHSTKTCTLVILHCPWTWSLFISIRGDWCGLFLPSHDPAINSSYSGVADGEMDGWYMEISFEVISCAFSPCFSVFQCSHFPTSLQCKFKKNVTLPAPVKRNPFVWELPRLLNTEPFDGNWDSTGLICWHFLLMSYSQLLWATQLWISFSNLGNKATACGQHHNQITSYQRIVHNRHCFPFASPCLIFFRTVNIIFYCNHFSHRDHSILTWLYVNSCLTPRIAHCHYWCFQSTVYHGRPSSSKTAFQGPFRIIEGLIEAPL